jgi:hypothetical protein
MEIKGDNLEKILSTIALWHCHSNFCHDCTHEGETYPNECTSKDCYERICEVLIGAN